MRGAKPGLNNEDPLIYLPRKPAHEVSKGRVIYDEMNPPTHLYVVILGRVKVSSMNGEARQSVSRIVRRIVSCQMNRLRRLGLIRYSRRHLDVYSEAMLAELRRQGVSIPRGAEAFAHAAGLQMA